MAATMNFFRVQDEARGRTAKLVLLLALSVAVLIGSLYVVAVWLTHFHFVGPRDNLTLVYGREPLDWIQPKLFCLTGGLALVVIIGTSLVRIAELSKGGGAIADRLGGRLIGANTKDLAERRYLNVVQEMALASGLPVPLCYVIDRDATINAFAAGNDPQDAAIGVTRGALAHLTRDELQGVIAHEFSHIANGDMKLSLRIIGAVAGLTALAQLGYIFLRAGAESSGDENDSARLDLAMVFAGFIVIVLGGGGVFFAKLIQASVSRQREYLADASAVQFTRNPLGLASALKKIAGLSGAKRAGSNADLESQHLFFASSGGFLEFLFSTHPPIMERIRLVDPTFDGIIPDVVAPEAASPSPSVDFARAARVDAPSASEPRALPTDLQIQDSVVFRGKFPSEIVAASQDPVSAMALVVGLILRADPGLRSAQLEKTSALAGGEVAREVVRLEPALLALPVGLRLPVLDLAMPALRQLSPGQEVRLRDAITQVGYDADDGLIVLLIQASMRRYLSKEKNPPCREGDLPSACGLVLSAVIRTSGESAEAQQAAYRLGVGVLGLQGLSPTLTPSELVDLQKVEEALEVIAGQGVYDRRRFVRACGTAMLHDGKAEPAEIEIVRAVADSLGITFATGLKANA